MKRLLLCAIAILFVAPIQGASANEVWAEIEPTAGGHYFDDELSNRSKPQTTITHHVEVNAGFITGGKMRIRNEGQKFKTNFSRPYLEVVYGVRLHKFIFVGIGVGAQYAYGECRLIDKVAFESPDTWGTLAIPIYGNIKACYPVSHMITPYISVGVGGNVIATSNFSREGYGSMRGGLFCKFGAGLTVGKFNFGLGMTSQNMKWLNNEGATNFKVGINSFYVEAGVRF